MRLDLWSWSLFAKIYDDTQAKEMNIFRYLKTIRYLLFTVMGLYILILKDKLDMAVCSL